ncbi:MAG: hypothetical protein CEE38_04225 [Planctomycetes bacterium B3_Pla]|nr:MAG: hypothetical protein CEE38_04225 [Planctomycetes bacterium B3_Pla]
MRNYSISNKKNEVFEKTMMSGLAIFVAALAIVGFAGSGFLTWQLWLAFSCFSVSLPYLIFQIACMTLGVTQRHKVPLQVATVIVALVGIFASLINLSIVIGGIFAISCLSAYYLFTVCSTGSMISEGTRTTGNVKTRKAKADAEAEADAEADEKVAAMAGASN